MKYTNCVKLFILTIFISVFAGCFLFGTKGILDKSNYKIVKLEIDNRVILSPQELTREAKERLNSNLSVEDITKMYEINRSRQANRIDNINDAFAELKTQSESKDKGTPLSELANITLVSTFNLDKTQGMLYGKAGCNDYTAKFFWQDTTKIVISGAAGTRKVCAPKEIADFQNTFIRNLDGIYTVAKLTNRKGYVLNNGKLRIYLK
ncbi:META domain-containing protein [Helicobacter saguini]|uniref:META domain-containing protein n=1 Tax=Helicobacter saguini TaxID=1548018 RepID=A0A347VWP3_9HELI|nr:META domain-containing protein [Helicobacter saguini]MWV61945.1 META domain-containing protein [Helicobacter saguini]MWV67380.1 META domain-containing protein [Helicobacter saguini]MWV69733.1 META domain-containing protein [Helicobacter saguini]MWV73050.1 META domain-containing protein [Helicobacter saguini]TLD95575.1 META domain-containing protein [Helicobacter saguini]